MKTLILETSTEKSCLALSDGLQICDFISLPGGPDLSKRLALEVSLLLKKNSFLPKRIAVGCGPGSFTGIRVGAALAKGLAFGWQIPLIGFCSLKAFAFFPEISTSTVLFDARMGGVYALIEGAARLLPIPETQTVLRDMSSIASPHPALIQKRLSLPCTWIETDPNPTLLAQLAHEKPSGLFQLNYPIHREF